MATISATGSVTIRRIRYGDTVSMAFDVTGALVQYVNSQTGTVTPDWTNTTNQPTITPVVTSARSQTVTFLSVVWKYNGFELKFGTDGYSTNTGYEKTFYLDAKTGKLTIKKNLASTTNIASDTLEVTLVVSIGGQEYTLTKSIDITIQPMGASSYSGYITTDKTFLKKDGEVATLTAHLMDGSGTVNPSNVKWYSGDTYLNKEGETLEVNRDMVNGSQLFIAKFYVAGTDTPIAVAGIVINDSMDDYQISFGSVGQVDDKTSVTVTAKLMKFVDDELKDVTSSMSGTWELAVYEMTGWTVIEVDGKPHTSNTNSITVTTKDTDYTSNGTTILRDVEVIASFSTTANEG